MILVLGVIVRNTFLMFTAIVQDIFKYEDNECMYKYYMNT